MKVDFDMIFRLNAAQKLVADRDAKKHVFSNQVFYAKKKSVFYRKKTVF